MCFKGKGKIERKIFSNFVQTIYERINEIQKLEQKLQMNPLLTFEELYADMEQEYEKIEPLERAVKVLEKTFADENMKALLVVK